MNPQLTVEYLVALKKKLDAQKIDKTCLINPCDVLFIARHCKRTGLQIKRVRVNGQKRSMMIAEGGNMKITFLVSRFQPQGKPLLLDSEHFQIERRLRIERAGGVSDG